MGVPSSRTALGARSRTSEPWCQGGDPRAGRRNGQGEPRVRLHSDPRRSRQPGARIGRNTVKRIPQDHGSGSPGAAFRIEKGLGEPTGGRMRVTFDS